MRVPACNGVNLGGWFVIEKWITPSLFEGIKASNEFELSRTKKGRERIKQHHEKFIQLSDLKWLRENGIEIVRVPVGYWILGGDERYVEATERLDWFMQTSLSLGLKVLLDLHAAPGAQNRAEHSGSGNTAANKHSTKWLNDNQSQDRTIEWLCALAERYHDFPNLWGIQLLNEPAVDLLGIKLARFYRRAYKAVVQFARPGTYIVFSDGYAPLRLTNCMWLHEQPSFPVAMDCHIYQVFGSRNKKRSFNSHIRRLRFTRLFLEFFSLFQPILVGEWSAMLPHSSSSERTREYALAQKSAFRATLAHMYWNYKTEAAGRWNFRDQAEKGLIQ